MAEYGLNSALRQYYCPTCGNIQKEVTNHTGEIYTACRSCKSTLLYHIGETWKGLPSVKAVVNCYSFDLGKAEDAAEYKALCEKLKGARVWKSLSPSYTATSKFRQRWHGKTVKLFNVHRWPDQYMSNAGRLRFWHEWVVDNKQIKLGYWLERRKER